jgi:hypothetical protein
MALSKTAKIWIIIASIPVVLLITVIIGLKIYLTSDRLKALIIPKIEDATRRSVKVQDVSFSILPSLAVSIDGLRISNPAGIEFERDEFLSLDNMRLKVNIFQLLGNKLEINYIILDHPKIFLEVLQDGVNNYSTKVTGEDRESGKVHIVKESGGELLLSNLEIKNAEIEYINKKSDSHLNIIGLNQITTVQSKPGEQNLHIEGTTSIEKLSYGTMKTWFLSDQPLTGKLAMTYKIDRDILMFDAVNAKLRELPISLNGSISKLLADEMYFDLEISSLGIQMSQLLSLVPPDMLKKTQGMESSGDVKFIMNVKGVLSETTTPGATGTFTVTNGKIKYASLPKSITNINIAGSFEKPEAHEGEKGIGRFGIEKLNALVGSNQAAGKLSVSDFDDPSLSATFSGSMNLAEVKDFYPLEKGTEVTGIMTANVSLEGKVKLPQNIKANGKIEFQNVTIQSASSPKPLHNLNGIVTFNNQLIESRQLAMIIGESDLNLTFVMKNYLGMVMEDAAKTSGIPSASVTLTSKQLRTVDLMPDDKQATESGEKKKTLKKQGGLLPGFDIDANVNIGKLMTEKFEFNNAHGSVFISNGIINLKNFSINAFQGNILTKGTLDVRDPKKRPFDLDLDIVGVESNSILPNFTSFGNNIFGKFSMNTKIKGDLNDTLGLNTKTLAGNGKVQIFDGKLLGFPLTSKLADFTNITELREVNFKNWTNAFSIADGRVNINDLKVNAGTTDFLVNGSHGLDGSMTYNLTAKLPGSVSDRLKLSGVGGQLLQFFKDKDGRINLNFDVTGMTASPQLKLNTKAQEDMAKQALEQEKQKLLDKGKGKVEDELKKKVGEGLKKLFKKP